MNKTENPRKALGKGLGALLPTRAPVPPAPPADGNDPHTVPIDSIDPNPLQPRRVFQAERLGELAQSIRANGIIQPLVVRVPGTAINWSPVSGGGARRSWPKFHMFRWWSAIFRTTACSRSP